MDFIVISVFITLCICATNAAFNSKSGIRQSRITKWKHFCQDITPLRRFSDLSLEECTVQCNNRPRCKALKYNKRFNICELLTEKCVSLVKGKGYFVYIDMNDEHTYKQCSCGLNESCLQDGTCAVEECEPLTAITNGEIRGNMNKNGSKLKIECKKEYETRNGGVYTTCNDGSWNPIRECVRNCGIPPSVNHSSISPGSTLQDTKRRYSCDDGYMTDNEEVVMETTCDATENWTDTTFSCKRDCGSPQTILNSVLSNGLTTEGTSRLYTCDSGYSTGTLNTPIIIECKSDGKWTTPSGSCVVDLYKEKLHYTNDNDCGPILPIAMLTCVSMDSTIIHSEATYSCIEGYRTTSPASALVTICLATGQWSAVDFTCTADCGTPPSVTHSSISAGSTLQDTKRTYICDNGYMTENDDVVMDTTCGSTGQWTDTTFICKRDCGLPPNIQNSVISNGLTTEGTSRLYTCDPGYSTGTSNTIISIECQSNGKWTIPPGSCVIDCGSPPNIPNSVISNGLTTEGTHRVYMCDSGYSTGTSNTPISIECKSDGKWTTPSGSCVVDCGTTLPTAKYASVSTGLTVMHSERMYSCIEGYHTSSPASALVTICLATGQWSDVEFTCTQDSNAGQSCSSSRPCTGLHTDCFGTICFCNPLYRYNSELKECYQECSVLSDTFEEHEHKFIRNFNIRSLRGGLDECKLACRQEPGCNSIDMNSSSKMCHLNMLTLDMARDTYPSAEGNGNNLNLHTRTCIN